jgi:hypothetical protein
MNGLRVSYREFDVAGEVWVLRPWKGVQMVVLEKTERRPLQEQNEVDIGAKTAFAELFLAATRV